MKRDKIIYWISTGLLSLMMVGSAVMYVFKHGEVAEVFAALGYPTYLVYPLAIAKLLGVLAIITKRSRVLKEFAYAGFLYDFLLAAGAHLQAGDGEFAPALVALAMLIVSYIFDGRVFSGR